MLPTRTAPASFIPRPGHGREDFEIWMQTRRGAGEPWYRHHHSFTVDGDGRFTKEAPGFEGRRVIDDKGDKGDANEAVIKALVEAGMLDRARAPQASVSALLALQEAGDLPQHAAVVHRHGQAAAGAGSVRQRQPSRARAQGHRGHLSSFPPQARNRLRGMVQSKARLGDLAPARLGRAHHRVPASRRRAR